MAFVSVKDKLATILTSISGTGKPLQSVFSYLEPSPQAFPCAMVDNLGSSNEVRLDSISNLLTMRFVIRVLARSKNTEAASDDIDAVKDAVLDALRLPANVDTLGGTVIKFDIESCDRLEGQTDQPVVGFDIRVAASIIVSIL